MGLREARWYGLFLIAGFSSFAARDNKVEITSEITRILGNVGVTFSEFYAPKDWKTSYHNWNLENELTSLGALESPANIAEFHDKLKKFFVNTRDYHTGIYFADTSLSTLPIGIKYINGDFYIAYIDSSVPASFSLLLGDKVTSINEVPVKDLALELINNIAQPSPTDWALAAKKLTARKGIAHDKVEKGPAVIKIERDGQAYFGQLVWNYTPNYMNYSQFNTRTKNIKLSSSPQPPPEIRENIEALISHVEDRPHKVSLADHMKSVNDKNSNPMAFGVKESFLPKLGNKIVWSTEATSKWQAYIYLNNENKLIGFIRLPTFSPQESDYGDRAKEFGEIINKMQELVEVLIIDQQNNPGGSIFYLYGLLSMLADQPLKNPHHRFTIDSKEAWQAHDMLKNIDTVLALLPLFGDSLGDLHGYPLNQQFFLHMKSYFQFIIEQWQQGKTYSEPYFLYGVDYIQPHPLYRYTKKLVVLINELDFSAGDFFPAILQDSGRAILVGTRTAGAGGYVLTNAERNHVGVMQYSYTGSHALRADKKSPIEDLGVTPDIFYEPSVEDLKTRFLPFRTVINTVVSALLVAPIETPVR
jgi:C-terminal processing protease CtpA/Prc